MRRISSAAKAEVLRRCVNAGLEALLHPRAVVMLSPSSLKMTVARIAIMDGLQAAVDPGAVELRST